MPLLGDLIVRARNAANDPCQVLSAPIAPTSLGTFPNGIFNGTVFVVLTYLTQWGETQPTSEQSVACSNQAIALDGLTPPPPIAATAMRMYFGAASGAEQQYIQFAPPTGTVFVVGLSSANPVVLSGTPPYKSSAYLPDTDGDLVSASDIYRWINAGLVALGRRAGGILDQTGVAMPAGNAEVQIPGWWLRFISVWHNGWLTLPEQQNYTWLQSPVTGIPGIVTLWRNSAAQVVGTWPQPSTPPATTTLSANMGLTDTVANIASGVGFTAPGMCQIDGEIMSYSASSNTQLTGIVRGYSGTIPVAHSSGATATQLILRLLGRRMPVPVSVGQSANLLDLPQGWDEVMDYYLASKFKETEQNIQEAQSLMQQFEAKAIELRDDQIPMSAKQVGGLWPLGGAAETLADVMDTVIIN